MNDLFNTTSINNLVKSGVSSLGQKPIQLDQQSQVDVLDRKILVPNLLIFVVANVGNMIEPPTQPGPENKQTKLTKIVNECRMVHCERIGYRV